MLEGRAVEANRSSSLVATEIEESSVYRLKQHLRLGASIVDACYGAGFGSSRALYERAKKTLGMTPSAYRRGGEGTKIQYVVTRSDLGYIVVAATQQGLCTVILDPDDESLVGMLRREFPNATLTPAKELVSAWRGIVRSCHLEDPLLAKLPMDLRVQIFRAKVLIAFRK